MASLLSWASSPYRFADPSWVLRWRLAFSSHLSRRAVTSAIFPHPERKEVRPLGKITAEYIWIDGQKPTAKLRSKTKIIDPVKSLGDIPDWGYDGSSTFQA